MGIEKEVGTEKFSSKFHRAIVNLYFAYKWVEKETDEVFHQYDLLAQHFNILRIVKEKKEPCSIREIRDVIMDKGRDFTRLIDKLEKKGFLKRELNPNNRRQMLISLTKSGLQMVNKVDRHIIKKIASIESLSDKESDQLNRLLDKVRK